MQSKTVSRKLLKRLPLYLNYLKSLPEDFQNVSATAMAKALEVEITDLMKDLPVVEPAEPVKASGKKKRKRNENKK